MPTKYVLHNKRRSTKERKVSLFATAGRSCAQALSTSPTGRPFCGTLIDLALENRHRPSHPAARWLPPLAAIVTNRINFITSVFCFPPNDHHSIFAVLYSASFPLRTFAPYESLSRSLMHTALSLLDFNYDINYVEKKISLTKLRLYSYNCANQIQELTIH